MCSIQNLPRWNEMKHILVLSCVLLSISCTRKSDYENTVDKFRSQTIGFYTNPKESPLDSNELKSFKGISYFPIDVSFKVMAQMMWLPQTQLFEMKQSGGDTRQYMKVAELHFEIGGKSQTLMAYQTESQRTEHKLFIPFTDATNGKETYGGGRYLDVIFNPASTEVELDFNFAYAPFCAYTHSFSCPVVPAENRLECEVRAGEKAGGF